MSRMLGAASRSSSGASSSAPVRRSMAGLGGPTDRSVIPMVVAGRLAAVIRGTSGQDGGEDEAQEAAQRGWIAVYLGAEDSTLKRVDQEGGDVVGIEAGAHFA